MNSLNRQAASMGNRSSRNTGDRAESGEEIADSQPGYYQQAQEGYKQLVNAIIRPPRSNYELEHLGPIHFKFYGRVIIRRDITLFNSRGMRVQCSMWEHEDRKAPAVPCVIYMHGNSSSRVEGLGQLSGVLKMGSSFLAFDFAGSGLSDGDYVSLGFYERDDLATVIAFLREEGRTSTIGLWGRSMGAATAMLHAERDPSIAAMVLDSAFSDLVQLAKDMVDKGRQQGIFAPGILISAVLYMIKGSVRDKAKFDINDISPIKYADKCYVPALFAAAEGDDFISPSHSQAIYDKYAGDKNIMMVDGDHNSPRPDFFYHSVLIFLQRCMQVPEEWGPEPTEIDHFPPGLPPWYMRGVFQVLRSKPSSSSASKSASEQIPLSDAVGRGGMSAARQAQIEENLMSVFGGVQGIASVSKVDESIQMKSWVCSQCTLKNTVPIEAKSICTVCEHEHRGDSDDD